MSDSIASHRTPVQADDAQTIEDALRGLAEVEEEMELAERAAEVARLKQVGQIYSKRRQHTRQIDKFWHIVLSQHPEFAEYIRASDFKYLELIKDIYVSWDVAESEDNTINPGNFSITFEFEALNDDFTAQVVTKRFKVVPFTAEELASSASKRKNTATGNDDDIDDDEDIAEESEHLVSQSTDIVWPASYEEINPAHIADKKSVSGKKNYRTGMKSFFGWFKWTGLKPGKEFPNGGDLARLLADDIFPSAVMYYTEAQRDGLEEEVDSDASEPLDLSEDEVGDDARGVKRRLDDADNSIKD